MIRYTNFAVLLTDSLTTGNADTNAPVKVFYTGTLDEAQLYSDNGVLWINYGELF